MKIIANIQSTLLLTAAKTRSESFSRTPRNIKKTCAAMNDAMISENNATSNFRSWLSVGFQRLERAPQLTSSAASMIP